MKATLLYRPLGVGAIVLAIAISFVAWWAVSHGDNVQAIPATAEPDAYFVRFEGVEGEAVDLDHLGWSDLLSFNKAISSSQSDRTSSCRGGGTTAADISLTKEVDKATPKLQEACLTGKVFPKLEIHVTASYAGTGRLTYYAYELTNARVASYSASGSSREVPTETLSLNFEKIKVTYTEYDSAGSEIETVEHTWKINQGKP